MRFVDRAAQLAHTTPSVPKAPGAAKASPSRTAAQAERELLGEMLAELRQLRETTTELAARERGGVVNGVLDVRVHVFDASGLLALGYQVGIGSLLLGNLSTTATVTVQAGTQSGDSAPTSGRGVQVVPAASWLAVPIGSHAVTLYGTAGETIDLQVFTGMQALGVSR
jgi:hypothetical protein